LTENVAFLIDFDPNLMVFDMDGWAYAVVDNSLRKSNVGELSVLSPPRPRRTRRKDWARNGHGGQAGEQETGKSRGPGFGDP
jgi:hypothetical protein